MSNHSGAKTNNVVFVDIDYPDLIKRKTDMIRKTKDILEIIGEPHEVNPKSKISKNNEGVMLYTPSYIAIGCDLTLLDELSELLRSLFNEPDSLFAFTAEVSITYMPQKAADDLIAWASKFTQSRFVLLEQILPSGPDHPFAKTMLRHFNKLNTPLNSVLTYRKVSDQRDRYRSRGWNHVQASDLFQFWEKNITNEEKEFLNSVEAFDEWEEFILFCQHYVILYASNSNTPSPLLNAKVVEFPDLKKTSVPHYISTKNSPPAHKKFAAGCVFDDNSVLQNGGFTTKRTNNNIILSLDESQEFALEKEPFKERMCHELTKIGQNDFILTGGRLAPSAPLSDCWRLHNNNWSKLPDLPDPRCRHVSFSSSTGAVYIFGGSPVSASHPWLKFDASTGWVSLNQIGDQIPCLMSPAVAFDRSKGEGFIFGGMTSDYLINSHIYSFKFESDDVVSEDITSMIPASTAVSLQRYGAKAIYLTENTVMIAGGVSSHSLIPNDEAIVILNTLTLEGESVPVSSQLGNDILFPLLSGFNLDIIENNIVIYGGGAICFSFGAYWNDITVLSTEKVNDTAAKFTTLSKLPVILEKPKTIKSTKLKPRTVKKTKVKSVPRISIDTLKDYNDFLKNVYSKGTPVVFEKVDLGSSVSKWIDPQYLIKSVGGDRKIVAHVSDALNLNFLAKNFKYETMEFQEFIESVFKTNTEADKLSKNLYLRSLSSEKPMGKPAVFRHDFSSLSNDFILPHALQKIEEEHFSSPFRISSPNTAIWLHYDVTANILCQVVGRKRVRLYPPSDVVNLSFPAGASTSLIENIFEFPESALPGRCKPIETILEPGDVIFIPATWLHATLPLETSISLNFFWKDLSPEVYGGGKDIYGNKDIEAYENGRRMIQKIKHTFEDVPDEIKKFYLLRLAEELKKNL